MPDDPRASVFGKAQHAAHLPLSEQAAAKSDTCVAFASPQSGSERRTMVRICPGGRGGRNVHAQIGLAEGRSGFLVA